MIRYERRKLEFGIWNLIKGPDFSVNGRVIVSNDHSLQFTVAVLRYLFLKEPDTECQVSTEYGTLLIACYHHLEESCVEGTDGGQGAHVSDFFLFT
ncbi:hypothetical protein I314_01579 [Cryptococcus bacillisporus CA1873]|uniref:Uncharacterized protein n=1 Tax=Cryptococcus bacillisporus CA1873 TaxID=1296111 RepID=A0ABR5BG08_CRYGA|nr:hypothetical protein I314_01579 [Cryptococcus bacillisporus CA1873]|eukprot:KIR68085.1 hypothetical protein I314_01579 [Cryptococcus gattii CA1873]